MVQPSRCNPVGEALRPDRATWLVDKYRRWFTRVIDRGVKPLLQFRFAAQRTLVFKPDITHSLHIMWKIFVFALGAALTAAPLAAQTTNVDLANLRQDIALLDQRQRALSVQVETLTRENEALRKQVAAATGNVATMTQLNDAVADLNKTIRAATADSQRETLQKVSVQMEALARQTNASLQSISRSSAATPVAAPSFNENYPKEGITYTIERGDTLSSIAQKLGSSLRDIVNANKITDPTKIQVGQTLFIPGGK